MTPLTLADIKQAALRLENNIKCTPIFASRQLNQWMSQSNEYTHQLYFKAENLQVAGAFKARGAYNTLAWLKEQNKLPNSIVAYSSGNHAQSMAWAAQQFGIKATILMAKEVSKIKVQATKAYGAEVILCQDRASAEAQAQQLSQQGAYLVPPFDHDQVICGQGTAILEALEQQPNIDAIFVPCGGGGLLSGSLIAAKAINPEIKVFGVEPSVADDAAQSLATGKVIRLPQSPNTIADGVRTLSVSERTLSYIKHSDGIITIDDQSTIYWTQWLTHLLKLTLEPTSALAMAAAEQWLKTQNQSKNVLILLSGGNIDHATRQKVWQQDLIGDNEPQ